MSRASCSLLVCSVILGLHSSALDAQRNNTVRQPLLSTIPGCYRLHPGAWETDSLINRFYQTAGLPRLLTLDTARLVGWDALQSDSLPMFTVRTLTAPPRSLYSTRPFIFWRQLHVTSDSIFVAEPLPLGGAMMKLAQTRDGLSGVLITSTDAVPPDGVAIATAPISLDRVECPTPR